MIEEKDSRFLYIVFDLIPFCFEELLPNRRGFVHQRIKLAQLVSSSFEPSRSLLDRLNQLSVVLFGGVNEEFDFVL